MLALSILWVALAATVTMIATVRKAPARMQQDAGVQVEESGRALTLFGVNLWPGTVGRVRVYQQVPHLPDVSPAPTHVRNLGLGLLTQQPRTYWGISPSRDQPPDTSAKGSLW